MSRFLVLDVGGSGIKHAVADEAFALTDKGTVRNTFTTHDEFIEGVGRLFDASGPVDGIAISSAGELDPATGHMFSGGYLRFNAGTNLIASVSARCPTRVSVENDANCALLAEVADGALTGCRTAAMFVLGTGLGGALLIDGRIHYGAKFHAGNASFTLVDLDDPDPKRLLGLTGGAGGLVEPYRERTGSEPGSIDGRTFFERFDEGDPVAVEVLDEYASRVAAFLYNVHVLIDPDAMAIGGGISAHPALVPAIDAHLQSLIARSLVQLPTPVVRVAQHRNDANLLGALRHHLT